MGFYRLSWVIHHKIGFLMKNLINSHEFRYLKSMKRKSCLDVEASVYVFLISILYTMEIFLVLCNFNKIVSQKS